MCIDDEQFSVPRATQSNTKLVELQSRSFVGPFVASIASFSRNARTKTRLGIKVKVRARFNLDLGEGGGGDEPLKPSARPIVARNIVVAQVQSPRTHDLLSGYQHAISKD